MVALGNVSPLLQWVDFGPYCAQERHHLFQDKERELALMLLHSPTRQGMSPPFKLITISSEH
jgi:hypothetical protein